MPPPNDNLTVGPTNLAEIDTLLNGINEVVPEPITITGSGNVVSNHIFDLEIPINFNKYIGKHGKKPNIKNICVGCGKILKTDYSSGFIDEMYSYGDGEPNEKNEIFWVCIECVSKFTPCVDCKRYQKSETLQLDRCAPCIETAPQRYIKNYTFKVERDLKMRGIQPKDQIYYGVELELESDNLGLDVLIVNDLVKEFARLKRDASIKKGFEIVTTPATIEEHNHMWDEFFDKLPKTCKPLQTCGMHVHASRNRMTDLQIGKILVFLHAKENQEFIKLIAGRDKPVYLGRDAAGVSRGYDVPEAKKISDVKQRIDRHTALNLNNDATIEFRIFWATRDKRIFLKNIEFCKALIKFSDWAMKSISEVSHYKNFVAFVREQRKEYEYLALFLETASMKKLLGE